MMKHLCTWSATLKEEWIQMKLSLPNVYLRAVHVSFQRDLSHGELHRNEHQRISSRSSPPHMLSSIVRWLRSVCYVINMGGRSTDWKTTLEYTICKSASRQTPRYGMRSGTIAASFFDGSHIKIQRVYIYGYVLKTARIDIPLLLSKVVLYSLKMPGVEVDRRFPRSHRGRSRTNHGAKCGNSLALLTAKRMPLLKSNRTRQARVLYCCSRAALLFARFFASQMRHKRHTNDLDGTEGYYCAWEQHCLSKFAGVIPYSSKVSISA